MQRILSRLVVLTAVVSVVACSIPSKNSVTSTQSEPSASTESIWMGLGPIKDDKQDIYLASTIPAKEMGVCVIENGGVDQDGFCLPSVKDGQFFKVEGVAVTEKMHIKVHSKDMSDVERTRTVKFESAAQALPDAVNFALNGPNSATLKVADVFKKEYMVVEFSAYDCGPCREFAKDFNRKEEEYKKYFEEGKCSKMVVVNDYGGLKGRFQNWIQMLGGADSYLGKASFASNMQLGQAAKALGFNQSFGIPTLIMIDRKGNVVDSATANMPPKMAELCLTR